MSENIVKYHGIVIAEVFDAIRAEGRYYCALSTEVQSNPNRPDVERYRLQESMRLYMAQNDLFHEFAGLRPRVRIIGTGTTQLVTDGKRMVLRQVPCRIAMVDMTHTYRRPEDYHRPVDRRVPCQECGAPRHPSDPKRGNRDTGLCIKCYNLVREDSF